jgi:hypothetical protein
MQCLTAVRNLDYPGDEELGIAWGASKIYVNLLRVFFWLPLLVDLLFVSMKPRLLSCYNLVWVAKPLIFGFNFSLAGVFNFKSVPRQWVSGCMT